MTTDKIVVLNQTTLDSFKENSEFKIIENFFDVGQKILGADFGFVWLKKRNSKNMELAYQSPNLPFTPTFPRKTGTTYRVLQKKRSLLIDQVSKAHSVKSFAQKYLKSLAIIPITYKNHTYGNMYFCFIDERNFSAEDEALCDSLGNSVAQALTINHLHSNLQEIKHTLDHSPQPKVIFDPETQAISYYNKSLLSQIGLSPKQLFNAKFLEIIHPKGRKIIEKRLEHIITEKIPSSVFEVTLLGPHQHKIPAEILLQYVTQPDQPPHLFAIISDLREKKKNEEQIRQAAFHDTLTGLPNRFLFTHKLDNLLLQSRQKRKKFAVMFLDLDRFKFINDTAGHLMGDVLLKQVAQRLQATIKRTDTVSRLGGDEFVILLTNLRSAQKTDLVAERIQKAFLKPFTLPNNQEVYMNCSIGISTFPKDGLDTETLLKNADNALYQTKQHGGNGFLHYHRGMINLELSHLEMEKNLRKAINSNQLRLQYQPIIDLKTGTIKHMEALVRWQHPTLGLILPGAFIPYAEESGLIIALSQWVVNEICKQLKKWRRRKIEIPININISARELLHKNMISKIRMHLRKCNLLPKDVILELTETFLIKDMQNSVNTLTELKESGFKTALDDFGTGFASLNYLKRMPVNYIKIDQIFVADCLTNKKDAGIIQAMIAVAHHLNIKVIAEGVETRAQAKFLQEQGCDLVQGNYYSLPVGAEQLKSLLKKQFKT